MECQIDSYMEKRSHLLLQNIRDWGCSKMTVIHFAMVPLSLAWHVSAVETSLSFKKLSKTGSILITVFLIFSTTLYCKTVYVINLFANFIVA